MKNNYVKRTQKDYSLSFKLEVVRKIEQYNPYQKAIAERINDILKQDFLINTKNLDVKTMQKGQYSRVLIFTTEKDHIIFCELLTLEQMHQQIKRKTYKKKISRQTIVCRDILHL